jgi:membrane protease YdiL (CAAX protease family)
MSLPAPAAAPSPTRLRAAELLIVFGALPVLLALVPARVVLPSLLLAGGATLAVLLTDRTFDRRQLWNRAGALPHLRRVLLRALALAAGLLALTALLLPDSLLQMPRTRPALWVAVLVLYPVLSVYAQELIFRAFFFHRYTLLFGSDRSRVLASAAAFALAHLVMRNVFALVLSFIGGVLFARTYARSRSLLLAGLEHALLGDVIFTVGLGSYFFDGHKALSGLGRF